MARPKTILNHPIKKKTIPARNRVGEVVGHVPQLAAHPKSKGSSAKRLSGAWGRSKK